MLNSIGMNEMAKRKPSTGYVRVDLIDIAYESFSNMDYFSKWIPEGYKLSEVQMCFEPGLDDYDPDQSYLIINWKLEE
jgi:hypothetical protein